MYQVPLSKTSPRPFTSELGQLGLGGWEKRPGSGATIVRFVDSPALRFTMIRVLEYHTEEHGVE